MAQREVDRAVCEIMFTSDLHGAIVPVDYNTNDWRPSGLGMLASLIRRERERSPEMLLIDNGDLLQGSPLAGYAASHGDGEETHPFIRVLNELRYDAAIIGNHEFNYGLPLLRKAVGDSRFPWLSANIVPSARHNGNSFRGDQKDGGHYRAASSQNEPNEENNTQFEDCNSSEAVSGAANVEGFPDPAFGPPYIVKTLSSGVKIALLGATTHYVPHWEAPRHIEGLRFLDAFKTIRYWVGHIREHERPDVLVVSYHGGFERDLETGEPTERQTGENQGYAICRDIEGIDVLLTGHQHRQIADIIHGVAVVQPGVSGAACGKVKLSLKRDADGKWRITDKWTALLRPDGDVQRPDADILRMVEDLEAKTQAWLDQPIGRLAGDLTIGDPHGLRLAAHPFLSFVHQVQMAFSGAEISNAALLSEDARGFGESITVRDVMSNFIYPNTLTALELSGRDIRNALEQTARYFELDESGKIVVAPSYLHPKPQHYNYDMWGGISYELNIAKPIGCRVTKLERNGVPLDEDGSYSVVMNNYRASGGGDYAMYAEKPVRYEGADDMASLVERYIRMHQPLMAPEAGNWKVVAAEDDSSS